MESTIIHLSDLHFKNDADSYSRIEKLIADLGRLSVSESVCTAFTGDLVHAGDENKFEVLLNELFWPLIDLHHEILIVPGNHDVQRGISNSNFTDDCLNDHGSSYIFDNDGKIRVYLPNNIRDPLENYNVIEDLFLSESEKNYWGYFHTINNISFIGLNSTWLSRVRHGGESDRGNLRIEPYILN